ncbi:hypothetical protein J4404_01555, partial [Candidatus Woesearchaeota archaeon]|nr:hypothetical protein [Candidatus Woesearchaeota archaeon]
MPTGYTYIIGEKDITFKEFALRCARGFGALVEMRDDSLEARIPNKFYPCSYHKEQIGEAQKQLDRVQNMSLKEVQNEV